MAAHHSNATHQLQNSVGQVDPHVQQHIELTHQAQRQQVQNAHLAQQQQLKQQIGQHCATLLQRGAVIQQHQQAHAAQRAEKARQMQALIEGRLKVQCRNIQEEVLLLEGCLRTCADPKQSQGRQLVQIMLEQKRKQVQGPGPGLNQPQVPMQPATTASSASTPSFSSPNGQFGMGGGGAVGVPGSTPGGAPVAGSARAGGGEAAVSSAARQMSQQAAAAKLTPTPVAHQPVSVPVTKFPENVPRVPAVPLEHQLAKANRINKLTKPAAQLQQQQPQTNAAAPAATSAATAVEVGVAAPAAQWACMLKAVQKRDLEAVVKCAANLAASFGEAAAAGSTAGTAAAAAPEESGQTPPLDGPPSIALGERAAALAELANARAVLDACECDPASTKSPVDCDFKAHRAAKQRAWDAHGQLHRVSLPAGRERGERRRSCGLCSLLLKRRGHRPR